ncbi:MAG: 2-oxo acid dehydrogenase subunit E2 [Candidatus Nanohalobium sp.]
MTLEFEFPDTGEGVTEGKFLEWKVSEGDEVEEDQVLAEAETDKAVVEIPSPSNGVIKTLKASPGDQVEVGEVILEMETEGEEVGEEASNQDSKEDEEVDEVEEDETVSYQGSSGDVLALPKVRKLAEDKNVDLESIKVGERITEEEVLEAAGKEDSTASEVAEDSSEGVKATPAVRKLAREKKVDITEIEGSGRGGKITRNDVLDAAEKEETEKDERPSGQDRSVDIDGEVERVEMNNVKRLTAERMAESKFTAPHVTHMDTADVSHLVNLREEVREDVDVHLTYLPFIMKACYLAMQEFPDLNAELDEENDEVVRKKFYDFNIAVDTDRGLLVPKIKDVDSKNIVELASDINETAEEAREGKIDREKLEPGTFSISNIGVIGGEGFTPIINYPQVAILGVGKIQETPQVVEGEIKPRHTVKLSLSYDHRVVDGAKAARFMNKVIENLEKPEEMLMET